MPAITEKQPQQKHGDKNNRQKIRYKSDTSFPLEGKLHASRQQALSPRSAQNTAVTGAARTFLALPPIIAVDRRSLASASRTKITLQGWILNEDGVLEMSGAVGVAFGQRPRETCCDGAFSQAIQRYMQGSPYLFTIQKTAGPKHSSAPKWCAANPTNSAMGASRRQQRAAWSCLPMLLITGFTSSLRRSSSLHQGESSGQTEARLLRSRSRLQRSKSNPCRRLL